MATHKNMSRQEKTKRNYQLILETAIKLFNDNGYDETTISDISKVTGISNGSIYHLFTSKQEILKQIYNQYINISLGLTKDIDEKVKDPYNHLLKFMLDVQNLWIKTGPMMLTNKFRWTSSRTTSGCSPIQREELVTFIAMAQEAGTISNHLHITDTVEFLFTIQRGILYGWTIRDDFDIHKYSVKFWEPILRALIDGNLNI
ncbi:TetR/AcrR family transcriptional regulator [Clostridium sp. E02]|uniref:TetR/AcrR family transcriptional regulator n=1 Tax=Clostridium sp. E02 TaxID=2487134 RepID=UPI000F5397F9|nr:TetR/AcrR family transcriptional regulator [Clostridium sp. E02]